MLNLPFSSSILYCIYSGLLIPAPFQQVNEGESKRGHPVPWQGDTVPLLITR